MTKRTLAALAAGALLMGALAGCSGGAEYPKNEAGANAGKTEFTKDDARKAQPQRGGSEGTE